AVIGDPDRAILIAHRLCAAGNVDDRQAPVAECNGSCAVDTITIRSAVRQRGRHSLHNAALSRLAKAVYKSCNTAHFDVLLFRDWQAVKACRAWAGGRGSFKRSP